MKFERLKMQNWLKEIIRRTLQIFTGIFVFDMPGINVIRNLVIRWLICEGKFGGGIIVSSHVRFYTPHGLTKESISLGKSIRISENVKIDCSSPLSIGDNVWISEDVSILNHNHIIDAKRWKESKKIEKTQGLVLEEDCWIGAGSIILPQVSVIGKGAIVGAGSVVTKNIEPYTVVAGNPACKIGDR